jgi:hypothetical protein
MLIHEYVSDDRQTQVEKMVINKQPGMTRPKCAISTPCVNQLCFFKACATTNDAPPIANATNKLLISSALRHWAATRGP